MKTIIAIILASALAFLLPFALFGAIDSSYKELQLRGNIYLIERDNMTPFTRDFFYMCGKIEGIFEAIEIMEQYDQEKILQEKSF